MTTDERRFTCTAAVVPLAFVAGGVAARSLLLRAPAGLSKDLGQPLAVVTAWHGFGAALWLALAVAILTAGVAAMRLVRLADRGAVGSRIGVPAVFVTSAVSLVAALTWPVIFSSDVYAYAAYGEQSLHGVDPYLPAPRVTSDAFLAAAAWQWGGAFPPCVYGEGFVAVARVVIGATQHLGVSAALMGLRFLAAGSFLAAAAALWWMLAATAWPPSRRLAAFVAIALNPVALWAAAEGHNDALMLAVALIGAALALRWSGIAGGLLVGMAALIKAPAPVVGLGAIALTALHEARRLSPILLGVAMGVGAALVAMLPRGLSAANGLRGHPYQPQFSLQGLAASVTAPFDPAHRGILGIGLVLAACVALGVRGAILAKRGERDGIVWIAIAVWLAIPNPYPWYAVWVLPVAGLAIDTPLASSLWVASIASAVRYLPDAFGTVGIEGSMVIALTGLAPFAPLIASSRRRARRRAVAA